VLNSYRASNVIKELDSHVVFLKKDGGNLRHFLMRRPLHSGKCNTTTGDNAHQYKRQIIRTELTSLLRRGHQLP